MPKDGPSAGVRDALEIVPVTDVEELLGNLGIHPKEPTRIAS